MRPVDVILIAAAAACAQGCATASRAAELDARAAHQKIAWTKGVQADPFRDQHGVCQMFTRDSKAALPALGEQVKACFEGALPEVRVEKPEGKSVKVAWNRVSRDRVNDLYAETNQQSALIATSTRRRSPLPQVAVRGFFTYAGDVCNVVVPEGPAYVGTLGHEFKHCVDGLFHNERGDWIHGDQAI